MSKTSFKGSTLLAPLPPAMVSCGDMENSNIITIGWTGILNSNPPVTYISIRPSRHSYNIVKESGEFVINLTTEALAKAADYCGIYTGAKVDKFKKCNLTKEPATNVACPMIAEAQMSIECRVKDVIPMGTHDVFVADILAVNVSDELIDESGKIRMDKAKLVAYTHGEYFALGKKLGTFGFSAAKKKKRKPAPKK
jgi:flavin reductase (DIM6/NTAB) family NADH-FMN oxidoreductase RutF